jgi:Ni,Fe-hydrogenase III large subunit/NADH:ubiquinone oxidoreductase subunit C
MKALSCFHNQDINMSEYQFIEIKNNDSAIKLKDIPVLSYDLFSSQVKSLLADPFCHCAAYYAADIDGHLKFICCIANDRTANILIFSHEQDHGKIKLKSLTPDIFALHIFEREINENYGVVFEGHPWLKPVRFAHDRFNSRSVMDNYPFYSMESEELHEVGVGPIHAGVIEPGHFRFICNGEKVLHLEIQLGYQHRGIERLIIEKKKPLQQSILSESISGDSVIAHSIAHSALIESLSGTRVSDSLQIERCIALELERIAMHIGDTAALCGDIAYQLGQVVNEALRTSIINTTQLWCGNRFGKGLIKPGGSNYKMTTEFIESMLKTLEDTGKRYNEISDRMFTLPNVLSRFDGIGIQTQKQAHLVGAVGMAARSSGVVRDIRKSHPFQYFREYPVEPITQPTGDVLARAMLRNMEVKHSIEMIKDMVNAYSLAKSEIVKPDYNKKLQPDSFALSLTETWRGEVCHTAITDKNGEIFHYKVKDPSFHNWMALALAVRNQEISDFPVCNKSFNLSYCGNDL